MSKLGDDLCRAFEATSFGCVVLHRNTILTFGKYKGVQVGDVVPRDPGYIRWLVESGAFEMGRQVEKDVIESEKRIRGTAREGRLASIGDLLEGDD